MGTVLFGLSPKNLGLSYRENGDRFGTGQVAGLRASEDFVCSVEPQGYFLVKKRSKP